MWQSESDSVRAMKLANILTRSNDTIHRNWLDYLSLKELCAEEKWDEEHELPD
jgi:hypothetical protein